MILVECRNVAKTFDQGATAVVAVHGTSCAVQDDDRIAIVGPSGSGKSTLLHLLAGLEEPTSGTVERDLAAREVGVIFQSPSLIPTLSVAENVSLPLALRGRPEAGVSAALAAVGGSGWANGLPDELSGGQAQRVAVARVLAAEPALILADEPTGQLDRDTGDAVVEALLEAAQRLGAALVIATHDPRVAARFDQVWRMHDGRLTIAPEQVRRTVGTGTGTGGPGHRNDPVGGRP